MGEEPENEKNQSSESHNRKLQLKLFHQVPLVYNSSQHEIPDSARITSGLNQVFVRPSDYDKLCMSLLCGLPNEQELALNVCTILSNEGNYMLHLEQTPKLVNLLLAQVGIWPKDDIALKMLYLESWMDLKGRNVYKFWRSTLDLENVQLVQLLGLDLGKYDPDYTLLNLESDSGTLNLEGQRVLRVALILHNLSFEKNNVPVLVENSNFIRFNLLCLHSSWANLKQIAYDTLSNLAYKMSLIIEKDICSRIMFQTVMDGIMSPDRYMNIRSMDILSQLCSYEPNEDIIPSSLDISVYQQLVSFLSVHDIMLLFCTLEALYALSDLGRYACDKIVCVHRCIGVLVSLLTLEPNHYGSSGQINMKIVETLVPAELDTEHEEKPVTVSNELPAHSSHTPALLTSNDIDSETFASNWLKSMYEISLGYSVSHNETYAEYVSFCSKAGRKGVVNANIFASCIKNSFPTCGLKKVESESGVISFHLDGLRKKANITQVGLPSVNHTNVHIASPSSPVSYKPGQKSSLSPILKAQLSAPPRSGIKSPPLKQRLHAASSIHKNTSFCVPNITSQNSNSISPVVPVTSGSSTLIKSLLANKVQQRNLQRQVVPQSVSKMVIYSSDKVNSVCEGVAGTPNKIVRCIRPSVLSNVNLSSQSRTSVQTRILSNRGRLITSSSQRHIRTPIVTSKVQSKIIKQTDITSNTSIARLNGVQRDVHMEVYAEEDSKNSLNRKYSQINQENHMHNHISADFSNYEESVSLDSDHMQSFKDIGLNKDLDKRNISVSLENLGIYKFAGATDSPISAENLSVIKSKSSSKEHPSLKEKNGTNVAYLNNTIVSDHSHVAQPINHSPKIISSASHIIKSVLGDLDNHTDCSDSKQHQNQKDKICKRAPLLNGLLDRGKMPLQADLHSNTILQNGSTLSNIDAEIVSDETSSNHVQLSLNTNVISVSSLNSLSPSQLDSQILPSTTVNSDHSLTPSLNSTTVSFSACSSPPPSFSSSLSSSSLSNSSAKCVTASEASCNINSSVLPATVFHSNGDNLMEICSGQTTLSGKIEVQTDQNGVVRLHIESPENSNQGSELASISDIARTLESASKAISKTNAECSTPMPYSNTLETTTTMTVITSNTPTLSRTNQQIIVTTPSSNQHIQSPNVKFRIPHSIPNGEESSDLANVPKINLSNQIQPAPENPSISTASIKRPSNDASTVSALPDSKRLCADTKTPLLEATLRLTNPVPCTYVNANSNAKSFQETQSFLNKSSYIDNLISTPKLTTANAVAVPVQNVDLPNDKEARTFSGLSSASDNPSFTSPLQAPPKSMSGGKLEYVCEWKDCGTTFSNPGSVFLHASKVHAPLSIDDMVCLWEGCDSLKRRRFSLLTHLQDWHCNERALHTQAMRWKQLSEQGKTSIPPPQLPPPHPGYAPDAAFLAIRRHALQYISPKELSEEKESALTKSIRLTSALILRNLVTHSSLARTYLRRFEPELAYIAMSPVESSRTIAQCLSQLSRPHD